MATEEEPTSGPIIRKVVIPAESLILGLRRGANGAPEHSIELRGVLGPSEMRGVDVEIIVRKRQTPQQVVNSAGAGGQDLLNRRVPLPEK